MLHIFGGPTLTLIFCWYYVLRIVIIHKESTYVLIQDAEKEQFIYWCFTTWSYKKK
jgi:hypothetical protein